MRVLSAAVAAMALLGAPPAFAKSCECRPGVCVKLQTDVSIQGVVSVRKKVWMLKLDRPTCFKGNGDADDIMAGEDRPAQTYVQLAPQDGDVGALRALIGKRVALKGDAFGAQTRHHVTEALFAPKTIEAVK